MRIIIISGTYLLRLFYFCQKSIKFKQLKKNPFHGEKFQRIWLKYFHSSNLPIEFKSIKYVKFYKNKKYPLYLNIGKNITNGMYYEIDEKEDDYKRKTFLIYDIPNYFKVLPIIDVNLNVKRVEQYEGFSVKLTDFNSFEEYFTFKFNTKKRYRFNRNLKRLETNFNISYKIFYGNISKNEYDFIFKYLIFNIKKRFDELNIDNDIVKKKHYYYELAYELICNKEAVLSVIYDGKIPISISINFVSEKIMYFAITSFNTDYHKYDLGHINIMKLLTWCFNNGISVLDFSKGYSTYKTRWANNKYHYEHHILYDNKSLKSIMICEFACKYFAIKQYLRTKKVNKFFSKIKFLVKGKNIKSKKTYFNVCDIKNIDLDYKNMIEIDLYSEEFKEILNYLYTQIYYKPEKISNIKIYKSSNKKDIFYAIGEQNKIKFFA